MQTGGRTDLAVELKEGLQAGAECQNGMSCREEFHKHKNVHVSTVVISDEEAAKVMGKQIGTYITVEAPGLSGADEKRRRYVAEILAEKLLSLTGKTEGKSILVVGLGNRDVTPDALGPQVVDNLFITRHILMEYGSYAFGKEPVNRISGLVPGVMAQTGMESLEIIKGVVNETKPDVVLTVDALAARSMKRLGRTIQLTDTGIVPGSGVGNHRNAINKENLGVPVISIGIPTVVDAATIVADAVNANREMTEKIMSPQLNGMFVTPKNIDDTIKQLGFLVSEGLNIAFSKE